MHLPVRGYNSYSKSYWKGLNVAEYEKQKELLNLPTSSKSALDWELRKKKYYSLGGNDHMTIKVSKFKEMAEQVLEHHICKGTWAKNILELQDCQNTYNLRIIRSETNERKSKDMIQERDDKILVLEKEVTTARKLIESLRDKSG